MQFRVYGSLSVWITVCMVVRIHRDRIESFHGSTIAHLLKNSILNHASSDPYMQSSMYAKMHADIYIHMKIHTVIHPHSTHMTRVGRS